MVESDETFVGGVEKGRVRRHMDKKALSAAEPQDRRVSCATAQPSSWSEEQRTPNLQLVVEASTSTNRLMLVAQRADYAGVIGRPIGV